MGKLIMKKETLERNGAALRQLALLRFASKETLTRIEEEAKYLTFGKGQEMIARSEESDDVFVVLTGLGRVTVFSASGKAVNFRRIAPGDIFGEFAAIDGERRSATVEAVEPTTAISMNSALFRELMEDDKAFMHAVVQHLVGMLRAITARVVEFSTLAVTNRIHCEILRMASGAEGGSGFHEINPAPTHSEIAGRISTHREAVSREISRLKQLGIIETRGRALIVRDFARLERMVHDATGE
jgi:CRP/FNR family cyclic AMP-dependent transcriptional regulator